MLDKNSNKLLFPFLTTLRVFCVSFVFFSCSSLSNISDAELEQKLETCKTLGMPPIPCDAVRDAYAERVRLNFAKEKEMNDAEERKNQDKLDAKSLEIAKTMRMPSPGMVDANLSKQMLEAYANTNSKEKLVGLRAVITSRSFVTLRNELTGIIVGRGLGGVVAMKRPNGECFAASSYFEQEFDGQRYTNLRFVRFSTAWPPESTKYEQLMDCANVFK